MSGSHKTDTTQPGSAQADSADNTDQSSNTEDAGGSSHARETNGEPLNPGSSGADARAGLDPIADVSSAGSATPGLSDTHAELLAMLEKERLRQDDELRQVNDRLMRAHAEMENLRKRTEREKADTAKYAVSKFALDIVTIADNLQRAMDAASGPNELGAEVKGLFEGVALTAQELVKTLEKHGIRQIEAEGGVFDPHLHQAIMEQPDTSVPAGTVTKVFQQGYVIGERVLRPAMVVVARGGPKPGSGGPVSTGSLGEDQDAQEGAGPEQS
ncbi:MAG: nucleotide exchange factor GrpE [Hyphomicrobiaceae bacterium]